MVSTFKLINEDWTFSNHDVRLVLWGFNQLCEIIALKGSWVWHGPQI